MANKTITIEVDEQIAQIFEQTCADMGMSISAWINTLIKKDLRERGLLSGADDDSLINEMDFQQLRKKSGV